MNKRNLKDTLQHLLHEHHLLSAGEILDHLKNKGKKYNKTSVYRALDQLEADGTICQHHFNDTQAVYELQSHHHAHAVCQNCGLVQTVECEYHQPRTVKNFAVDHHHVTLMGLCADCQV